MSPGKDRLKPTANCRTRSASPASVLRLDFVTGISEVVNIGELSTGSRGATLTSSGAERRRKCSSLPEADRQPLEEASGAAQLLRLSPRSPLQLGRAPRRAAVREEACSTGRSRSTLSRLGNQPTEMRSGLTFLAQLEDWSSVKGG